ncbi:MAG TPA: D-alanyl-D-alanine carboxypeptidase/D-alanyl-D-alanine-endopeptidase [Prolixibacteraceae bacterium]|nr:D-alanyl-D-alanine carboxypeptidase/D-alanyl-D-alanine-endopeptidase [Prolixibacteraceae bacterium]
MSRLLCLFTLIALLPLSAFSQLSTGRKILKQFAADTALSNAVVSICAIDVNSGEVLLKTQPQLSITPASVQKLLTTATAFEVFGNNYQFVTVVGTNGEINSRTLNGNLVILGGGDPTLGSAYFNVESQKKAFLKQWSQLIKQAGIDTINGNIIANPNIYADLDVPQTWIWEDLGNYFGAAAKGIAIYDNTFKINFNTETKAGLLTKITSVEPLIPELKIENRVIAASDNRDRAYVFGSPFDAYRIVKGTLPAGRKNFSIKASVPDPALLLAHELYQQLSADGLVLNGVYGVENEVGTGNIEVLDTFFKWHSPALNEIAKQLNYESINLFAEHLCKHLGLVLKAEGSTKAGCEAIKEFWTERNIDTRFVFLADGSGLSRANALSSETLVDVLRYMHQNSLYYNDFLNSIPLTGINGTQKYYFTNSVLKGKVHSKSGSMTRVRSFAGYMTTLHGTEIAYAVIVNNFDAGSFEMASKLESLIEQMYAVF